MTGLPTTPWLAFPKLGSFFRLCEGTLQQAPMLLDGRMETDELAACDVAFGCLDPDDEAEAEKIKTMLSAPLEPCIRCGEPTPPGYPCPCFEPGSERRTP